STLCSAAAARQVMQRQVSKTAEIMEKSNKTLLHLETQNNLQTTICSPPPLSNEAKKVYNFKTECEQSIVKILEQFQLLMQQTVNADHNHIGGGTTLDDCLAYRQRAEYLGSSVRKLVAFCDSMDQLKLNLQEHEAQAEEDK
ncbi:hypothetical protein KR093_006007, partial [Drosophila rubida]